MSDTLTNAPTVEYKVRSITRYAVTRYCRDADGKGCSSEVGQYPTFEMAYEVGCALAKGEQERLGLPPGDMGVIFPDPVRPAPEGAQ